ncbi:Uncharacterized protein BM_BM3678 [Brugia malayi]|uniref:Uncharacterized protein n=1 Tax=Brugia malayi TaxID=6279 RepID=A0A4E9ERG0_BRUMA|nr:Uncharacterized protein BM_BM3678 [Brugia malayi]VIO86735.1 Uncharacterized protein BM_BM3678 [Brugia malayi]
MGSQQSRLLKNRQQQQPGLRRQHRHIHHLLKKRASIRHLQLQRSSIGFSMNKIYRSSSQSYPYPRTHTLVVVPPSRPVMENNAEKEHTKMRPPLNRTIPPIPESKSSDSIITHISEKRVEAHDELEPSTSRAIREPSCDKFIRELVPLFTAKELQISPEKIKCNRSAVTENRMAHNLVTKTAVIISNHTRRSEDVPRSPLMTVAHSVRSKLTKLGNRFSRSDGNQNIRTSSSLSSMRRGPVAKLSYVPPNAQCKKSASMETRTNHDSNDSIKFVPSKQAPGNNALRIPRIPRSRTSLNNQSSRLETYRQNVLLNQGECSKIKNLLSRSGNDAETNSGVKAFKIHLEPRTMRNVSPSDRSRQFNSTILTFTMTAEARTSKNEENIKEAKIKPTMNIFVKSDIGQDRTSSGKSQHNRNDHEQMKAGSTSRQKSFIPLYTTSRKLPASRSGTEMSQAPLAECESSCIENSPAVEVSPLKFIPDEIHYGCIKESSKDRATKSQIVGSSSSTNSVKEACRNQFLSSELTYNCVKATREKSLNDKRKDGCTMTNVALRDGLLNNNLPDNYTDCFCDNDVKSRDNPNAFVSPTAVTLSGLTTSSGYQYFPDKFPDKDAELSEQFVDMTIIQKFVFPGYSFQLVKGY